jgi:hypothetical protein
MALLLKCFGGSDGPPPDHHVVGGPCRHIVDEIEEDPGACPAPGIPRSASSRRVPDARWCRSACQDRRLDAASRVYVEEIHRPQRQELATGLVEALVVGDPQLQEGIAVDHRDPPALEPDEFLGVLREP